MTVTLTHTVSLPDHDGSVTFDQIWESMLRKAENPVGFVPSITECTVVERYPVGFLREVLFWGTDRVRERVVPQRDRGRILFEVLDNPEMTLITNELTQDEQGRFSFTLTYVLAEDRIARLRRESEFIDRFEDIVRDTASTTATALRATAATFAVGD